MQLANVIVALNGERGNSVPKDRVTAAEIAVLMAIHGTDSVYDIEPLDETVDVSARAEVNRLRVLYPGSDAAGDKAIEKIYPGAAPSVHETIEELGLDPSMFRALTRAVAPAGLKKAKPPRKAPPPVAEIVGEAVDETADALFE